MMSIHYLAMGSDKPTEKVIILELGFNCLLLEIVFKLLKGSAVAINRGRENKYFLLICIQIFQICSLAPSNILNYHSEIKDCIFNPLQFS